MKTCDICREKKDSVKWYNDDGPGLPENTNSGYYCDDCVANMNDEWWENESQAYCDGNCDDCVHMMPNGNCRIGNI